MSPTRNTGWQATEEGLLLDPANAAFCADGHDGKALGCFSVMLTQKKPGKVPAQSCSALLTVCT